MRIRIIIITDRIERLKKYNFNIFFYYFIKNGYNVTQFFKIIK